MYLDLRKSWPGPKGTMEPGIYQIPKDVSQIHACCAAKDGAGVIGKDQGDEMNDADHDNPEEEDNHRKGPAPENKLQPPPPNNKTGLEGSTRRRRRSRSQSQPSEA